VKTGHKKYVVHDPQKLLAPRENLLPLKDAQAQHAASNIKPHA
jgi:hypothetical protein